MYKWILVLIKYIDGMVCWELKALRIDRPKFVLQAAAGTGEREGTVNIVDMKKESGKDYERKILEFLEAA